MVTLKGEINVDGNPRVEKVTGEDAERFKHLLEEYDTVDMTLTTVEIVETSDHVQVNRDSFDVNEDVPLECIRRVESSTGSPGIEFEAFPVDLIDNGGLRVSIFSHEYKTRDPLNEVEVNGWRATVHAIEKPDKVVDMTGSGRGDQGASGYCPSCGQALDGEEAFCPSCGEEVSSGTPSCPECDAELSGNESFCPACGHTLSG